MAMPSGSGRRRAGRTMVGVGVVGVIVGIVGTVAGWRFLDEVNASTTDTLTVTIDVIDSIDLSIELVDGVLDASADAIETTADTLRSVVSSFDESAGVIESIQDLTDVVGPTLEDAAEGLRSLESVASGLDDLLRRLTDIPFAPSYDPELALGPRVGDIADDLATLPEEFARTSDELDGFVTSLDDLSADIDQLSVDIDRITAELANRGVLIDRYRTNIADARAIAVDTRDGLGDNIGLLRLLLVIGGVNFVIGQIVPFWIGRGLLRDVRLDETTTRTPRTRSGVLEPRDRDDEVVS